MGKDSGGLPSVQREYILEDISKQPSFHIKAIITSDYASCVPLVCVALIKYIISYIIFQEIYGSCICKINMGIVGCDAQIAP